MFSKRISHQEPMETDEITFREKLIIFADEIFLRISAGWFWTIACTLVLAGVILMLTLAERRADRLASEPTPLPASQAVKPSTKSATELGDIKQVLARQGSRVLVALDARALDEIGSASPETRPEVAARLVRQNRAFELDNHGHVLVVGFGFGEVKIRALEGVNRDRSGWVPSDSLE